MSRPAARPRAGALLCAITLAVLAAGVSVSFAQEAPSPPAPPDDPSTPVAPEDPAEPTEDPPADGQDPPADGQDPPPPAEATPSMLNPFPVVVIAGRQGRRATRVTELRVRGPRGARVVVRCVGKPCPMRRVRRRIPRTKRLRLSRAQRVYSAGTSLVIRVTGVDRIGKYTRVRFRSRRIPSRSDSCVQPGETKPSPCPS